MSVVPDKSIRGEGGPATYLKDFFEKVTYRDDLKVLEISGLPAGEYVLMKLYPYFASIVIRIGVPIDSSSSEKYGIIFVILLRIYHLFRYLLAVNGDIIQPTRTNPLQITSVQYEAGSKNLVIKTTAKSGKARLHMVFRRFLPQVATVALGLARAPAEFPLYFTPSRVFSRLLSTRSTNPEYQYILNRRGLERQCILFKKYIL